MDNDSTYSSIQGMLNQIEKPFPNVGRYMNINSTLTMFIVPIFFQIEKISGLDPRGYAPVPLVLGGFALVMITLILEVLIATQIFMGMNWMMNVPLFFAIGVIRNIEGAKNRYREAHISFYKKFQANRILSTAVLIVSSPFLFWQLSDWLTTDSISNPITTFLFWPVLVISLVHTLIATISKRKQQDWIAKSDTEIDTEAERKRMKVPEMAEIPSMEEMKKILTKAKYGDFEANRDAKILNQAAKQKSLWRFIWPLLIFISVLILLI